MPHLLASSSSSSSLTPSTASFAPPPPAKAQSPHASSTGPKALLQWKPVSSKASSSSFSFLAPSSTASFASPSPAKAQPPHATSAGAKASQLSEPSLPSLVSSKALPSPVKAQSPHAESAGPIASLQWKPVSSKASSSSFSFLAPSSTASFASPSPAKAQPPHASSAGAKASQLSEPSSPSLVLSKAASSSSSSLTPSSTASSASPSPVKARSPHAASANGSPARAWPLAEPSSPSSVSSKASSSSASSLPPLTASFASPQFEQQNKIGQLPRYEIPKHLQEQIKNDVVPQVLKRPLSQSTYADYFAALLYAEDYYCEKWSDFILHDVTLELRKKDGFKIQNSTGAKKNNKSNAQKDKPFVAFEIDSVPENRPYLISRDHVLVRPAGKQIEPFQGIFFRVEKSKWVLAEFGDDFHKQHSPSKKYDVSFSFNRVCLKRCHHAVSAAMDPFLCSILFPDPPHKTFLGPIHDFNFTQNDRESAVIAIISHIINLRSPEPYLLEGPLSETPSGDLSEMGNVIHSAILQLYRTCTSSKILVCAPRNRTLDALTKSLLEDIPESRIFRANAAFREYDLVPDDIMPACSFEGVCFSCPPLAELENFRVVTSTFISTFRLKAAGIGADHFSHIFLVDASSSTEPETIVALANLVGKTTAVVVTGSLLNMPRWVRSDMARRNGLKKSFFQRLLEMEPYCLDDPLCVTHVYGDDKRNDGTMILPSIDTNGFEY
uniref:Helicase MOV-10-like beta-barrel domain-containing protein n=1 Tax=Ananas comosus var. bracteatus TaxID=296719 RepID=A0A6V7QKC0_ANACO|nr:unnamed protein product [Ananas comosus var. bracteatus]